MRQTSHKYHLFHRDYLDLDRAEVTVLAEDFGSDLNLIYEKIKISPKASAALFVTPSSEKGEGDGHTTIVPLSVIFAYQSKYHPETLEEDQPKQDGGGENGDA